MDNYVINTYHEFNKWQEALHLWGFCVAAIREVVLSHHISVIYNVVSLATVSAGKPFSLQPAIYNPGG